MSETKRKYAEKRLIHLTDDQKEKLAAQSHAKVQAHVNEVNQVQARRFELATALLIATVTHRGLAATTYEDVLLCRKLAHSMVEADCVEKWTDLKQLFAELDVKPPQAPLERAARLAGVTLFDVLPEEPEAMVVAPTTEELIKVQQ